MKGTQSELTQANFPFTEVLRILWSDIYPKLGHPDNHADPAACLHNLTFPLLLTRHHFVFATQSVHQFLK